MNICKTGLGQEIRLWIQSEKESCRFLGRQLIYFTGLIVAALCIWKGADVFHDALFEEYGLLENIQILLLAGTALLFGLWSYSYPQKRGLSVFLCMLTLSAFCRELDAFFDECVPLIGWKFAWFFPIIGGIYILRHFRVLGRTLPVFFKSSSFYLMLCALIVIVPIAQTIGHKDFIIAATGIVPQARIIRRMLEESVELEGYILILFSSVEYYFSFLIK